MRVSVKPIAVAIGLVFCASLASAASDYHGYQIVAVRVNGHALASEVPPIVMDGRTLVPLRSVSNALGGNISFDPDTNTVDMSVTTSGAQDAATVASLRADLARKEGELSTLKTTVNAAVQEASTLRAENQTLRATVPAGPLNWSLSADEVRAAIKYGRQFPTSAYNTTMHPDYVYQLAHPYLGQGAYINVELLTPWRTVAEQATYQAGTPSSHPFSDDEWLQFAKARKLQVIFSTLLGSTTAQRMSAVDLSIVQNGRTIYPETYSPLNKISGADNFIWWAADFRTEDVVRNLPVTVVAKVKEDPAGRWDGKTMKTTWDLANLR